MKHSLMDISKAGSCRTWSEQQLLKLLEVVKKRNDLANHHARYKLWSDMYNEQTGEERTPRSVRYQIDKLKDVMAFRDSRENTVEGPIRYRLYVTNGLDSLASLAKQLNIDKCDITSLNRQIFPRSAVLEAGKPLPKGLSIVLPSNKIISSGPDDTQREIGRSSDLKIRIDTRTENNNLNRFFIKEDELKNVSVKSKVESDVSDSSVTTSDDEDSSHSSHEHEECIRRMIQSRHHLHTFPSPAWLGGLTLYESSSDEENEVDEFQSFEAPWDVRPQTSTMMEFNQLVKLKMLQNNHWDQVFPSAKNILHGENLEMSNNDTSQHIEENVIGGHAMVSRNHGREVDQGHQKLVGHMWAKLSPKEREFYAQKASEHDHKSGKPFTKRATSAYNMFVREKFVQLRSPNSSLSSLSTKTLTEMVDASQLASKSNWRDHSLCKAMLDKCYSCGSFKDKGIPRRKHWVHGVPRYKTKKQHTSQRITPFGSTAGKAAGHKSTMHWYQEQPNMIVRSVQKPVADIAGTLVRKNIHSANVKALEPANVKASGPAKEILIQTACKKVFSSRIKHNEHVKVCAICSSTITSIF